jgi:hypothetical protein
MMAETRKKLTEIQLQQLVETQAAVAQARTTLQKAEVDAQRVVQLIFDAHDVPPTWTADIDRETRELVCRPPAMDVVSEPA